jgi:hypothetical protein
MIHLFLVAAISASYQQNEFYLHQYHHLTAVANLNRDCDYAVHGSSVVYVCQNELRHIFDPQDLYLNNVYQKLPLADSGLEVQLATTSLSPYDKSRNNVVLLGTDGNVWRVGPDQSL